MGVIEAGSEFYFSIFKISLLFSFIFQVANTTFSFVDLSTLPNINWDIADLNVGISALQNAKGLDIAVAIPILIIRVFALMIQSFVNAVLFINYIIQQIINILLLSTPISDSTALVISNLISWIILFPALVGIITDIGRVVFYLLFGARR